MNTQFVVVVLIAALLGGLCTVMLGWLESTSTFDKRKFALSALRSLIGAVSIAAAFNYSGSTAPICFLLAFLAGAGVNTGGNQLAGAAMKLQARRMAAKMDGAPKK
jgi:hypothetical protein